MRSLLDELTEGYSRLHDGIDPDTVDTLYLATRNLGEHLDPDVVHDLAPAAKQLTEMQSTLEDFIEAAPALRRLPRNLGD